MHPPLVVLVTGLPATGKTRLAEAIARHLGCPLVAKDAIKEPLLDVLGGGDRAWSRRLSDASFAVMFALARALMPAAGPFVLEGNFRAGEHERALRPLASARRLVQVRCTAPEPARLARLAARPLDPSRHRGHGDGALAEEAVVPDGFLELPGERITYDSSACEGTAGEASAALLARIMKGE